MELGNQILFSDRFFIFFGQRYVINSHFKELSLFEVVNQKNSIKTIKLRHKCGFVQNWAEWFQGLQLHHFFPHLEFDVICVSSVQEKILYYVSYCMFYFLRGSEKSEALSKKIALHNKKASWYCSTGFIQYSSTSKLCYYPDLAYYFSWYAPYGSYPGSNYYRAFHGFGQTKFSYDGLVLGSSQFSLLSQLPEKWQKRKNSVKLLVCFCAFGICTHESCT